MYQDITVFESGCPAPQLTLLRQGLTTGTTGTSLGKRKGFSGMVEIRVPFVDGSLPLLCVAVSSMVVSHTHGVLACVCMGGG